MKVILTGHEVGDGYSGDSYSKEKEIMLDTLSNSVIITIGEESVELPLRCLREMESILKSYL